MKLLCLLMIMFFVKTNAQTSPNIAQPKGYTKVLETRGDLDKDGVDELVLVYNTNEKKDRIGYNREIHIYKITNGIAKLWKRNTSVLWNSDDCGFCTDNGVDLSVKIKNNTLIIQQTFWHNTRHTSIFRYQNNDWFLIGSTYNDRYNCGYDYTYDINFSTNQVKVSYDSEDCEDGEPHSSSSQKNFKYPFKAVPKMDGFTAGKTEIKIPQSNKYFYY